MRIRQQRVITYRFPGAAENARKLGVSYSAYIGWLQTGTKFIGPEKRTAVEIVEIDGRGGRVPLEGYKAPNTAAEHGGERGFQLSAVAET